MLLHFSKYQGAGNDFIIINMMNNKIELNQKQIEFLCNRRFGIGADGLMLVLKNDDYDFYMQYFNADGKEGSMCGNGGRCIAKYAYLNKISSSEVNFLAIDGKHKANIIRSSVSLSMSNVNKIQDFEDVAIEIGIEEGYDYIICGHIHKPQIREVSSDKGKAMYLNSGDWVENLTALEYVNGNWDLFYYQHDLQYKDIDRS